MGIWSSHIANEEDWFTNNSTPSIQEDVLSLRNENEQLKADKNDNKRNIINDNDCYIGHSAK